MTNRTSSKVALFIMHKALPGKRDEVKKGWEKYMQPEIAKNKNHENYFYCYDNNNPDAICVYQQYPDKESSQAFLKTPNYKNYLRETEHLLAGEPEITIATPIWIKSV